MAARFDLVLLEEDREYVTHTSEAELRDALHAFADSYGWTVTAEVPVPGWGRIDLLLEGGQCWVVELKRSVTKPATLRRGITQVHGYAAALGRYVHRTILCAPSFPDWAQDMASVAYPDVDLLTVSELLGYIHHYADRLHLVEVAQQRLHIAEHEVAVRAAHVADLSPSDEAEADDEDDDEPETTGGIVTPEPVVLD